MIAPVYGYLLAILTSCCWAQNSVSYAIAGKRVTSHTVTNIRTLIAFPALVIVHLCFFGTLWPDDMDMVSIGYLALSGFTGFFITDICLFKTFVDLGPREGLVIMSLSPILSAIFSWILLAEQLSPVQIIGVLVTILGVMVVLLEKGKETKQHPMFVSGLIAGIVAVVMQAVSMILAKKGMECNVHPVSGNLVRLGAGLAGIVVFAAIRGEFVNDIRKMSDRRSLALIALAAMIGPVLGMILALYALASAPVGIVTTLMQITPVILLPVDHFIFKKKLTWRSIAGTLMAATGAGILFAVV